MEPTGIQLFTDNEDNAFEQLFQIYASSFPKSEQKSKEAIRSMITHPDYACYTLAHNRDIIGFTLFFCPRDEPFYLLEYMAIDPAQKSAGLGSALFHRSLDALYRQFGRKPLLIEIDSANANGSDKEINQKRENFYRKAGCLKIGSFTYILGLKTATLPPEMEMLLLDPGRLEISRQELRGYIESIYARVYGRSRGDPDILRMFDKLPETLPLH